MREIKFRYRIRRPDGTIKTIIVMLDEIRAGQLIGFIRKDILSCDEYTGLHDKNGKEIYHHDIVWDYFSGNKWLVEWDDENASFVLYEYPAESNAEPLWIGCATKMEVINSKYEVE